MRTRRGYYDGDFFWHLVVNGQVVETERRSDAIRWLQTAQENSPRVMLRADTKGFINDVYVAAYYRKSRSWAATWSWVPLALDRADLETWTIAQIVEVAGPLGELVVAERRHEQAEYLLAQRRSSRLLRSEVSPAQWAEWKEYDQFTVTGQSGNTYIVAPHTLFRKNDHTNCEDCADEDEETWTQYCVAASGDLPEADKVLTTFYHVVAAEEELLEEANLVESHTPMRLVRDA